ncbi:TetR/AcrR family transcriptional regulator [Actinomadura scrupuli]|uniref:TetR/AcrR family transcriptional regulator n=1 Tax=Actinomadura scrupuli TaxID=559629 RepID=UPI003D962EE8
MTSRRLRPRKAPRQERAIETRARLLAAAARVFSEHGYSAGTTNRIAEAAGHSIGSLYQYFPNKDAILAELVTAHAEAGIEAMTRRLDAGLPDSLEDKIRLFVRVAMDNHRDDPALHRVLFEEAPRPPELLRMLHTAEEQAIETARGLLAADPQVRVTDLAMAARLVVNSIESLVHRFYSYGEPDDAGRFEHELVAMLHHYLTGRAPGAPR